MEEKEKNIEEKVEEVKEEAEEKVEEVVEKVEEKQEEVVADTKKKGNTKLIIGIIAAILVVLILALGLLLPKLLMTNKKIVEKEIATVFGEAKKNIKEVDKRSVPFDLDKDSIGLSGELSLKSDYKDKDIDLTKLDKYKIAYNAVLDKSDNEMSFNLKLADKKDIINADGFIEGKTAYFNLGDIFKKTLKTETNQEIKDLEVSKVDVNDVEKLLTKIETSLKNNIKDEDITKETVEKEINGKKKKYDKVAYKVKVNDQTIAVAKDLKDDDEALEILANLLGKDKKEVKDDLRDLIDEAKDEDEVELVVNIYLEGLFNKAAGFEVEDEDDNALVVDINGSAYNYKIVADDEELGNGVYDTQKKELTFDIKDDDMSVDGELNWKNNNKLSGEVAVKSDDMKVDVDFDFTSKVKGKEVSNDLEATAKIEIDKEKMNFELKTSSTTKVGAKVDEISTKDAVYVDALSEEDTVTLYTNLMNKIKPIIEEVMPGMDTSAFSMA